MEDTIYELAEPICLFEFPPKSLPSNSVDEGAEHIGFFCDTLVGLDQSR